MGRLYRLEGHTPVPLAEGDIAGWARNYEDDAHIVCQTSIGDCMVSTVFTGVDQQYFGGPPLLFETAVFGPNQPRALGQQMIMLPAVIEREGWRCRYSTWDEAALGHADVCTLVQEYVSKGEADGEAAAGQAEE